MTGWPRFAEYARLARELDAVRAAEQARTGGLAAAAAQMSQHADGLEQRLTDQRARLESVGTLLRLRIPDGQPVPSEDGPVTRPAEALREVAVQIDIADQEATAALQRGRSAALLPGWPGQLRNLLIYGVAAAVTLAVQWWVWLSEQERALAARGRPGTDATPDGNPLMIGLLVPAACFLVSYLVVRWAGAARIRDRTATATPTATATAPASVRLGLLLCFGVGPAVLIVLILHSALTS